MKKIILYVIVLTMGILCACVTEENTKNTIMSPTPRVIVADTPENTPTPIMKEDSTEKYEKMDWTKLSCYADLEASLRNSNLLNEGRLTYDENGNIYFVDMNIGGIFISEWDGKNRRQISQESARALQVEGDWLYFIENGLKRIHISTGEEQVIYEVCGEAIVKDSRIYVSCPEGFVSMDLDGSNKTILREQSVTLGSYTAGEDMWLGIAYEEENVMHYLEGHLYAYDETTDSLIYLEDACWYPLLAGNWLSIFNLTKASRYVRNLETGEEFDLEVYAQKAVSDGTNIYYVRERFEYIVGYRWNGNTTEEIFRLEKVNLCNNMYLTPEALYFISRNTLGGRSVNQMWYYKLETGEIGQVY